MNKNLLKHKLLLLIFLIFCGNKNLTAQCFQIESILVDAFNSASSAEGLNEMVRFKVGPAAINTSNMSVVWASAGNPWLGLIQNATATAKIATINASILANGGCGQLIQPVGGVLPANANVLLITSYNFDPSLNIFGAITQNIYVLFQNNPDTTAGNFGNYSATPGLRTLIINFGSCADSVTYERSLLVNQLGSPGAEDGATVNFTAAGAPTYVNNGNTAPVVTFIVDAGPATIGVCAGDVIPLNGTAQGQQSLQWSAATGSFSNGASISTNYNVPMTATGNIVVRLTATNTCGGSKFDEITLNVTPQITPTFTQLAPICTGSNPPTLPTTSNNGITGFWTPTMSSTIARTYTFTPGPGQCATSQSMTTTLNNNCTFGDFASAVFLGNCTNANTFYNNTGSGVDRINATGLSLNNNNLGVYRQNSTSLTLKGAELKSFKNAGTNVCGVNLRYRFYLQTATPPVFQSIAMPFFDPCNTSTGFFNSGGPCTATDQKWQNLAENISLTNLPLGNYFLEVFYEIQGSNTSTTLCNDVVLVNNNGANFKARFTIAPQPTITSVLGANCGNNGSIVVNNLIPDTAYTYTMTQQTSSNPSNFGTGVTNNAGQFIINNLAPDIYSNITFQANGCSFVVNATATVGGTTKPSTPTFTKVDQNCNVAGTITINSPVGTNITYSTDNGANWQTSPLTRPAGTYNLIARNAANCISDAVEVVIDFVNPAPAAPVVVVTNGSCANALGSFTIQSPLGTNLEYSINGSTYQSAPVFTNVAVGSYNITARNATNCVSVPTVASITSTTTTLQPPVVTATQPTCAVSTGSILVNSPTGSQIIYSIDGTNFQSSNSFLNLSPSTFSVVYKDASGCTSPATSVAIQASTNTLTAPVLGVTNPNCANQTGQIVVQSPVGAQYVYSRDGVVFQNSNVFLNLAVGTYNFTYRDNAQCVSPPTAATLVAQSAVATPTFSKTDANCGQNGSITILSALGNNFEYSIDNINYQPATVFTNLTAATYQISVRNVVSTCRSATVSVTINDVSSTLPINLGTYPVCLDANNNPISSNIIYTGYSENDFDFAWTFAGNPLADTTSFLTVVLAGNYQAVATDKVTGCTQVFNATVTQVTGASATAVVATDFSGNQSITVKVTGGSGNFVYQINNSGFQPSNVFYVTKGGYYVIDIEDLNGCNVLQIMADVIDFPRFFTPNGDSYNDTWNVYGLPFPEKSQLFIFDRFGKLLKQVGLTGFGWDGNFNGQPLPADDYWFRLNYLDVNGMSREFKSHFTLKR